MTATDWWVVVPPGEVNSAKVPANARIIGVQAGSSDDSALYNQSTISYGGSKYTRYMGPFKSEASAKAATPSVNVSILDLASLGLGGAEALGSSGATAGGNDPVASAGHDLTPDWSLKFGNVKGLLIRILKVGIGTFLLLAGILKLTNAEGKVLDAARLYTGKLPGI